MSIENVIGEPAELPQPDAPAAPEPAAQDAQAQPDADQQQQHPDEPKVVPLAALHEERGKRKDLQAELARERERVAQIEARMAARLEQLARAVQPPPPAPPALEENPVGHFSHKINELAQQVGQLSQHTQAEREAAMAAQRVQAVAAAVQQAEAAFKRENPDYVDAVSHLHEVRIRELEAIGTPRFEAEARSARELQEFAMVAAAQGRNPAEMAYSVAKVRGYQGKAAQAKVSAEEQLAIAKRGTAAAGSLGNGGGAGNGRLSPKALLAMSDDEFAEATAGKNWARLFGA